MAFALCINGPRRLRFLAREPASDFSPPRLTGWARRKYFAVGWQIEGSSFVTFNVEVDDPQAYLDKAVSLGGQVAMPVTDMEMVTIAQFRDREGHMVGIVKKQPDQ